MGYLALLMMQRIDLSPLALHYMPTDMDHFEQVHKHKESIDIAAFELCTKFDLITCSQTTLRVINTASWQVRHVLSFSH